MILVSLVLTLRLASSGRNDDRFVVPSINETYPDGFKRSASYDELSPGGWVSSISTSRVLRSFSTFNHPCTTEPPKTSMSISKAKIELPASQLLPQPIPTNDDHAALSNQCNCLIDTTACFIAIHVTPIIRHALHGLVMVYSFRNCSGMSFYYY